MTEIKYSDIKVGDYIQATTHTYSQKWTLREGFENCNATFVGRVVLLGSDPTEMVLQLDDNTQHLAVENVGSSGWHEFRKLCEILICVSPTCTVDPECLSRLFSCTAEIVIDTECTVSKMAALILRHTPSVLVLICEKRDCGLYMPRFSDATLSDGDGWCPCDAIVKTLMKVKSSLEFVICNSWILAHRLKVEAGITYVVGCDEALTDKQAAIFAFDTLKQRGITLRE